MSNKELFTHYLNQSNLNVKHCTSAGLSFASPLSAIESYKFVVIKAVTVYIFQISNVIVGYA